ncbi:hypothetical protein Syun_014129 [Stephania yunnanensis]|uniref:Uncharacterized protein n=1 Tax=Stephania yunnanensis TaxID=152371 RepID=A0AAP0P990_9MAGN
MISFFLSPLSPVTEPSHFSLSHRCFLLLILPPLSLFPAISCPSLNFLAVAAIGAGGGSAIVEA